MIDRINALLALYGLEMFRKSFMTVTIMMDQARSDGLISREEWREWETSRLLTKDLEKGYILRILNNGKV